MVQTLIQKAVLVLTALSFILTARFADAAIDPSSTTVRIILWRGILPAEPYPLLPVVFKYRVINDSDSSVTIPPPMQPTYWPRGSFHVLVSDEPTSGLVRRYCYTFYIQWDSDSSWKYDILMAPRTSKVFDLVLGYEPIEPTEKFQEPRPPTKPFNSPEIAIFWKPGLHRIKVLLKAHYQQPGRVHWFNVESNEMQVMIEKPQGEDARAYDLLLHSKTPWMFCHPGAIVSQSANEAVRSIYERLPKSVYYPYAKFVVARDLCRKFDLTPSGEFPPEPLQGLEMLRELSDDHTFPCADLTVWYLAMDARDIQTRWRSARFGELLKGLDLEAQGKLYRDFKLQAEIKELPSIKRAAEYYGEAVKRMRGLLPVQEAEGLTDSYAVGKKAAEVLFEKYRMFFSY